MTRNARCPLAAGLLPAARLVNSLLRTVMSLVWACAVLPDAEDALGLRGLRVHHLEHVVLDHQAVVDGAAAGVRLHADARGDVRAVADAVAGELDRVARDRLVRAERVVQADVLVDVGRRRRGVQVRGHADEVVDDLRAVEGVGAARTIEHPDREVEVEDRAGR